MEILDRLPTDLVRHVEGFYHKQGFALGDYHRWQRTADVALKHFELPGDYYRETILKRDLEIQQRLCRAGVKVVPEQRLCVEQLKRMFVNLENYPGKWPSDIYLEFLSCLFG